MKKDDYIKGATSKIFSIREKKMVEAEFNDHILKNEDFIMEIGFGSEEAENKAVEKMGDYDEVAGYLGELHNDFYNPVGDIIGFAVWLALLSGMYYALSKYIFGDIGAVPITLATVCLSAVIFFSGAAVMLSRNRLPVIIGTLLCGGATSVFIYLCMKNVSGYISDNFDRLKSLVIDYELFLGSAAKNNIAFTVTGIFAFFVLIAVIVSLIYYIKYHTSSNTLFDNHFKKGTGIILFVISVLLIICTAFFASRFFAVCSHWYDEYESAYQTMLDMSSKCKTFDEVGNYLSSEQCDFDKDSDITAYTDKNGNISGYSYNHNLVSIDIEYQNPLDYTQAVIGSYGIAVPGSVFDDIFYYDYRVTMDLNTQSYFSEGLDSLSLSKFKTTEEELDEITLFDMSEHSADEEFIFYRDHIPNTFICAPARAEKYIGKYNFEYVTGNGKYKYTSEFEFMILPEEIVSTKNKITEIVKNNLNCSYEEIAELTGTELVKPDISYEDYEKAVDLLGSSFDGYREEMLDSYYSQYYFKISDDLNFKLMKAPYEYIVFSSDTYLEYISYVALTDSVSYYSFEEEPFKKMSVSNMGFFAKNTCVYSYDRIPYFEENGTRYTFFTENEDPGDKSGYIKHYYLVNQKGERYNAQDCYINSSGYLYFDTGHLLKAQADGLTYKDKNGNT